MSDGNKHNGEKQSREGVRERFSWDSYFKYGTWKVSLLSWIEELKEGGMWMSERRASQVRGQEEEQGKCPEAVRCLVHLRKARGAGVEWASEQDEERGPEGHQGPDCDLTLLKAGKDYPSPDFPGGPMVKNLPANAMDMGLIPCIDRSLMGKIPYVTGQLSSCTTATESVL